MLEVEGGERLVIDTGPDFRQQMLREGVTALRHVLYTHTHADHCHGFDDLRAFYFQERQPVECRIAARFEDEFRRRFAYAFEDTGYEGTRPNVTLEPFEDAPFSCAGLTIEPVAVPHGHMWSSGFRIGRFAYLTDYKGLDPAIVARWRGGLDLVVASGIHFGTHKTHCTIPETVAILEALEARRGVITHIAHEVDARTDGARLPPHVALGYDGLRIALDL
jgi:phosphoribosyl 1,2-cyclic phosphate phosphodiesterase